MNVNFDNNRQYNEEFRLVVKPLDNNNFALELYLCGLRKAGCKKAPKPVLQGKVKGIQLVNIRYAVYEALRDSGHNPNILKYTLTDPLVLTHEAGIRLAVMFKCVSGVHTVGSITQIRDGIRGMANEECHYWYGKVFYSQGTYPVKAIRVLFVG